VRSLHLAALALALALAAASSGCGGKTSSEPGSNNAGGAGGSMGGGPTTGTGGGATVAVGSTSVGTNGTVGTSSTTGAGGAPDVGSSSVTVGTTTGLAGTAGFGGTIGSGGVSGFGGASYCSPPYPPPVPPTSRIISDFERGPAVQAVPQGGVWTSDTDGTGSRSLAIESCGTNGSGMRFVGTGHTLWGADVAAAMISQSQPLDVSAFKGIRFVMTSASPTVVIVKVQNPYSQPQCGRCSDSRLGEECFSGFVKVMPIVHDVMPHVVTWSDLSFQTWGYRPPGMDSFDPRNFVSLAFVFDKDVDFDVCIDDVELLP